MKKVHALLLAAVMALSMGVFAACGGGDEGGDTAEVKVVKVWVHKSEAEPEGITYRALQDMFNEKKLTTTDGRKIVMTLEFKNSAESLATAISADAMSGDLPDVVAVDSPNITVYARDNILTPIDEQLPAEVKASYVDSVIDQSTYEGKLYALSGMDAPGGLYYNKELLRSVGYADSDFGTIDNPWSWKDVEEAMTRLKEAEKPYQIKLNLGFGGSEGAMYLYSPLVYSAGGEFFGPSGTTVGYLNGEKALAGMGMIEHLYAGETQNSWIYNGNNENALPGGDVAFEIYGPWLVSSINKNYPDFKNSYDIMPFPVYEDAAGNKGAIASPCGSWGFGVTPDSRDKYAAAQVVAYLTGPEASQLLYESIGTFPTHKSLFESIEDFTSGPLKSLANLLVGTAAPRPKMANYPQLSTAFADILGYIKTEAGKTGYDLAVYAQTKANGVG